MDAGFNINLAFDWPVYGVVEKGGIKRCRSSNEVGRKMRAIHKGEYQRQVHKDRSIEYGIWKQADSPLNHRQDLVARARVLPDVAPLLKINTPLAYILNCLSILTFFSSWSN